MGRVQPLPVEGPIYIIEKWSCTLIQTGKTLVRFIVLDSLNRHLFVGE
jgi:hypothetical protein